MKLKSIALTSFIAGASLLLFSCTSQTSSSGYAPAPRYATEGAISANAATSSATVTDESSLLHPTTMNQAGFSLDWSTSLMYEDGVRKLHLLKDTVLLESDTNHLHAIDRYTGHYKWVIKFNHPLDFPPTMMESTDKSKKMIYCISNNNLYAIDATKQFTGRELGVLKWKFPLQYTPTTAPFANEHLVAFGVEEDNFIATIFTHSSDNPGFVPQVLAWKRPLNGRISATPATSSDEDQSTLMVATEAGTIYGLNFYNGDRQWEFPSSYFAGPFRAPLLVHEKHILAASVDHTLYFLDRDSGGLLGKIVLDSPILKSPWAVGTIDINKDATGAKIVNINDDLDMFVQSDGSIENPKGFFYHIKVKQIVNRDVDTVGDEGENGDKIYHRLWLLKIKWKIEGACEYLFRTRDHFYLKQDNEIIVVKRMTGEITKRIDLGHTPVMVHYDPSSNYDDNRLFVATENGGVYSLQLK